MKYLFFGLTALAILCSLSGEATAQISTSTLLLEDNAMTLGTLNTLTLSAPKDNVLTTNYSLYLPGENNAGVGALWYISSTEPGGAYMTKWLPAGTEGQVLQMTGSLPIWQTIPSLPTGSTTNATLVWNGTQWVENTNVTMNPTNGNTTIGGNLTVGGTSVNLPNGSIDNTELANSSINLNYGTGVAGDASVALGGTLNVQNTGVTQVTAGSGINLSGTTGNVTITNSGVLAVNGTANQVNASTTAGTVTLSTPQDIHTGAQPTFSKLTLSSLTANSTATEVVVSNGGQLQTRSISSLQGGLPSLNNNSMWVGNSSNQATQLGSTGVNGAVLQLNSSGAPSWSNDLNVHNVAISSMLTVNGNQVNNGDVTFNGSNFNVHGTTNSVFDGPVTINGTTTHANSVIVNGSTTLNSGLTVNGSPVNLPNNSINNSELEHNSINVSYGTGLSGSSNVALGATLNLQNTGVTSLVAGSGITLSGSTGAVTISSSASGGVTQVVGTTNQVNVSPGSGTGVVTLSTPQNIHTGASPTFAGLNVTGGTVDIDGLTQDNTLTKVLVQDANGIVRTRTASSLAGSSGWSLTGNSGTTDGTNFLGTTDNIPFTVRVNNQRVIRIVPVTASPNIMAGYSTNTISSTGSEGNIIAGGGANNEPNQMIDYADYGFIGGGAANTIGYSADYAVIAGGYVNEIDQEADYSFIGAGQMNEAYDRHNVVVGGYQNKAGTNDNNWTDAAYATVVGGYQNQATAYKAFVGGGLQNQASGQRSAIVGGNNNRATHSEAFVGGGKENEAKADGATVAGGRENVVTGSYSAIPGGRGLTLSGSNSFGFLADNSGSNNMTVSSDDVVVFGNADLWLANNTNTPSQLRFYEKDNSTGSFPSSTDYSSFEAQPQLSSINYVLPDTAGILGDVLQVKAITGSKVTLDWATPNEASTVGKLLFARKTANESISTKGLQNDDHMSIALEANKTYEISGAMYVKQTSSSGGNPSLDITWTVPGGTGTGSSNSTMMISYFANESKSGNSNTGADYRDQSGVGATSTGSAFSDIGLSTNMVTVHFKGLVITGSTSGNIVLQWTPTTSNSQITVYKNSYMSASLVE
ncbi:MAG: beta strand repeat-containing protein [Candidatus Kapaibacterium sp.]